MDLIYRGSSYPHNQSQLMRAISQDQLKVTRRLLRAENVDPNQPILHGFSRDTTSKLLYLTPLELCIHLTNQRIFLVLLECPHVDVTANGNKAIQVACELRQAEMVRLLLEHNANPSVLQNTCFRTAARQQSKDILKMLLKHPLVDPSDMDSEALRMACLYGYTSVVRLLLEDGRCDPAAADHQALEEACIQGHYDIFQLLLNDPRVSPAANDQLAIKMVPVTCSSDKSTWSARILMNKQRMMKELLLDPRVDPSFDNNQSLVNAATCGMVEMVQMLLNDNRVRETMDSTALKAACGHGHLEIVRVLIAAGQDPAADEQEAIQDAVLNGYVPVVRQLMLDPRVDPAVSNDFCLRMAVQLGHMEMVQTLLQDPRVNPKIGNDYCYRVACEKGHDELADYMKQVCRRDDSDWDLKILYEAIRLGQTKVVEILLRHPKKDISLIPSCIKLAKRHGHDHIIQILSREMQ
ncbi:ankyrin repeat-containing domain protein [Gorgonomyces haynaldii]|nr:ankyrin repeat-containing domain protein [Gorgonomyces haynaldii]